MISLDPKKEIRDQLAHFIAGVAITMFIGFAFKSLILGALVSFGIMYGREVMQRLERGDPWYQCHFGCILDMACWSVGSFTGGLLLVLIRSA